MWWFCKGLTIDKTFIIQYPIYLENWPWMFQFICLYVELRKQCKLTTILGFICYLLKVTLNCILYTFSILEVLIIKFLFINNNIYFMLPHKYVYIIILKNWHAYFSPAWRFDRDWSTRSKKTWKEMKTLVKYSFFFFKFKLNSALFYIIDTSWISNLETKIVIKYE